MQTNKLFLDLDECMVHTLYADDECHANQLIDTYSEHWVGEKFELAYAGSAWDFNISRIWYVTFLRNTTRELLTFSRQVFGNDNVYMLSTGTLDYIQRVNKVLNLGFNPDTHVYGREDIERYEICEKFKNNYNVLVDDRSYEFHIGTRGKIAFLNYIKPEQYVRVEKFTVWSEPIGNNEKLLEDLKDRILTAFNYG